MMILTKNSLTIIVTITVVLSICLFHDVESFHCCPLLQQQQKQQQKQPMIPTTIPILRQVKSKDEDEDNDKDRRRSATVMNRRESVVRSILLPLMSSVLVVVAPTNTNNNNRAFAYDSDPDPLQVRIVVALVCVCVHASLR